jgi:hypothetical protein
VQFAIPNKGPGGADPSRRRLRCHVDPNQLAACAVSFKPSENAGTLKVCPGLASLESMEGVTPGLAANQAFARKFAKPFKPGCRYKVSVAADAAKQLAEPNEGRNANSYILVGQ